MREEKPHKIEVHVAAICFKRDKVLILKRNCNREIHPCLWECGGGQVKEGENFTEAIIRQMKEETNLLVRPLSVLTTYEIKTKDLKIPGIITICEHIKGEVKLSEEHTEYKWLSLLEEDEGLFRNTLIPGLHEDILKAYGRFKEIKQQ